MKNQQVICTNRHLRSNRCRLAKKLVDISDDLREHQWLHQHLSLAVVRGNTASILVCARKFDLILPVLFELLAMY